MLFTDLTTERLTLKNIGREDQAFLFRHFSDPHVCRYLFDAEPLSDLAGADEIIDFYLAPEPRTRHRWILVHQESGEKIGTCGFHFYRPTAGTVEVGYDLAPTHWRRGYMREALQAVITFAAEKMRVTTIEAVIYMGNAPSLALAQSVGFRNSGETKTETFRGQSYLHHVYKLSLT